MMKPIKTLTLGSTMLCALVLAQPATAQSDLEDRVGKLEALMQQILDRMDQDAGRLTSEEAKIIEQAQTIVSLQEKVDESSQKAAQAAEMAEATTVEIASLKEIGQLDLVLPEKGFNIGKVKVNYGGYVKTDVQVTDFSDGDPFGLSTIINNFYIPSQIPVSANGMGTTDLHINARESRIFFQTQANVGGHKVGSHIELDFLVSTDGNEVVSNSYNPRMRQAYFTIDNWLFGQAWTTFQNVGALPENIDFIGPAEGTIFGRQPMVRYTNGPFQFAIENPESRITTNTGGTITSDDGALPDFVARYNHKSEIGSFTAAALVRQLTLENEMIDDSVLSWGISLSGKVNVGQKDDFRFMVNAGEGMGRYVAVAAVNGAAIDANGNLDAIASYSGFASYRHFWNDRWRSNITGGYFKADNPVLLTTSGVTDEIYSGHLNLLFSPVPNMTFGGEVMYARRALESGLAGDMTRFQFSAQYGF
ncbi:MAG: DcaP family trimeric outer membrane transporter [Pseudomonadota bacterium]